MTFDLCLGGWLWWGTCWRRMNSDRGLRLTGSLSACGGWDPLLTILPFLIPPSSSYSLSALSHPSCFKSLLPSFAFTFSYVTPPPFSIPIPPPCPSFLIPFPHHLPISFSSFLPNNFYSLLFLLPHPSSSSLFLILLPHPFPSSLPFIFSQLLPPF